MNENSKCKFCKKEVDVDAIKCQHCHSDLRIWRERHPIIFALLIIIFILWFIGQMSGNSQPSQTTNTIDQTTNSDIRDLPRDKNGEIHQLKITNQAKEGVDNIPFISKENYTNCTDEMTVITMDGNNKAVFTTYSDNGGSFNVFTNQQYSIVYDVLVNNNGNDLYHDIRSREFGSNVAGVWGISCDQGQYSFEINNLK